MLALRQNYFGSRLKTLLQSVVDSLPQAQLTLIGGLVSANYVSRRSKSPQMEKRYWKGTALLVSISAISLVLLVSALVSTVKLPLLSRAGLLFWLVLLLLTLAASRFTVSVTSTDGVRQSRKSIADTFVFLAVILYAVPPSDTAGPATLLAAIVGFVSTYGLSSRKESIFTTGMAVVCFCR